MLDATSQIIIPLASGASISITRQIRFGFGTCNGFADLGRGVRFGRSRSGRLGRRHSRGTFCLVKKAALPVIALALAASATGCAAGTKAQADLGKPAEADTAYYQHNRNVALNNLYNWPVERSAFAQLCKTRPLEKVKVSVVCDVQGS
jgi:hypothetical protein